MSDLNLYKIPAADTSLGDTSNPANLGGAAIDNATSNPSSGGLNEQQVRDIVNSVRNTNGITENKVREIVNGMQKFLQGENIMMTGIQKSQNFVSGSSGWQIDAEGNAEFNDGTFRGTFNIGGTTITIDNTQDIQDNLDTIEAAGGGTLFLQNGTYTLTADITIPSGVTLQGVSRDGVILDCNTSYSVKIAGTNVYSTGTVTINNGDTTVVGSGTTWTAAMIGRYILLQDQWYEITARADNTHITIGSSYVGTNLSGASYVLADVNFTGSLRFVTVTGATGSGIVVAYAMEPVLDDLIISGCGTGLDFDYVVFPRIRCTSNSNGVNVDFNYVFGFFIDYSEFSISTTGAGVVMTNTENSTFFNSSVNDNTGDGINMTTCSKIAFISFDISGNGGQGVEFVSGCDDNQFTDGVLDGNVSDGIKLTASSDRNTLVAVSIINNGGYGINIAASTCDNNQIIAPAFSGNSSGTISDSGTGTFVSPQNITDIQTFLSSGTWTMPTGAKKIDVSVWGGGGGGGGNGATTNDCGGGGGGGGYNQITFLPSQISSPVTITIPAASAGGVGNNDGAVGGNVTFGTYLTGFGGGGGAKANGAANNCGGGGGGNQSAGSVGNGNTNGGAGGGTTAGAGGITTGPVDPTISYFGGGGGGSGSGTASSSTGALSYYGGGGGSGNSRNPGGASTFGGGGGGTGALGGSAGAGGASTFGGAGGAGGNQSDGGAGTQPGGGGGGSDSGAGGAAHNGGAGGKGKIVVTTYF